MSTWFRRIKKGIQTATHEKKEAPDGLWHKCPECKTTYTVAELKDNMFVCLKCNSHNRINSNQYFHTICDNDKRELLFENILPIDKLGFIDLKPYQTRIEEAQHHTGREDAMTV